MSEGTIPGVNLGPKGKILVTSIVILIALGLAASSSMKYESRNRTGDAVRPPPTYTGSAPLAITSAMEAIESNNDFILVYTPCVDEAINASILNIAITSADRIRSVDRIYVGVYILPQNDGLDYPTLMVRYLAATNMQYTFRSGITEDAIYNQYLNYKFMH